MDFELSEENRAFRDMVRRWVDTETPKAWARELERNEHDYPFALWDKFTAAGFHGIGIDEAYGGQGGDVMTQMILGRELARSLGGLAWIWGLTSFAGGKSIGVYGNEEQKKRFLPAMARGELRASIGFTEPNGGTDVLGALSTTAERVDGGWVINGEKIWCSSSHVADYILLLARTDKNGEKRHHGVTLFFVPAKQKGLTVTQLPKLGMRSIGSCLVHIENVFVPDDLVLGEPGRAWYMLLPTLNNERIMVGAFCLGVIDGVLEDALDYMKQRKAFGKTIGSFQALQHYVADIATWQKAIELMLHNTAWLQSQGRDCGMESSMLKVMASDYAVKAADLGIQILGGMGYSAETDMQRYWRDARLWKIGPITNEMARNGIAERLGLPRSF
ncbi:MULTISPECIES: acyl-CoA dehydrogenase family protein [unclassified Chelatococcus]|uniref:acyl-CoA dehydrogenase family protein n=1 Tax=unclassified Chelatococcus TaxID=2638111 RepID=UPI001BCD3815|nr:MULTISPECIES: acyl-CoA dehydrogenase family protein [unclassified Chelatococcus]CAH1652972.1 Alkylation response protein AidB-like acyl-CoA dehydrogenase [Hyphomicrobiales bacterium]MBS7742963.1 acyl-CoA/acyl-ACP dehydrogenase [Chelatococcus sp. HY11]MBX3541919.1 acyl-CoA/acyl-ACP dehydrogenase [Chelatococcus sp.]MCO5074190.1 acyl-CoA/acyl-ACP dehydrogenase [Chelatococcus sp.]CAH1694154.1 Alkylation response protein AidB-like acyl-CoA dehydrogenase [Hyphomicrobiales bacterium]